MIFIYDNMTVNYFNGPGGHTGLVRGVEGLVLMVDSRSEVTYM